MSGADERFDAYYFAHGCGRTYQRDDYWLSFFGDIAEQIVGQFSPNTVLDAGCALGFLVEALRARDVEAFGIDVSSYAIEHVHESVRPYCEVKSILEPLGRSYDLIVCIEVLEHLLPAEAHAAVANLCAHTSDVLFSSSPEDYSEATHLNVQPVEYWARLFAQHGFFRDTEQEPFVTPWSVRFRKTGDPFPRVVGGYERRLWRLTQESRAARETVLQQRGELAGLHVSSVELEEAHSWLLDAFFRSGPVQFVGDAPSPLLTADVPISLTPQGDAAHIQGGGHSLWCFRDHAAVLHAEADLQPGMYRVNGRVLTRSAAGLEIMLQDGEALMLELPGAIRDFSLELSVQSPAASFDLRFGGTPAFAALGDVHLVRVIETQDGPVRGRMRRLRSQVQSTLTGKAILWAKGRPAGARLVQSRVGRLLHRVIGPLPATSDAYDYEAWIEKRVTTRASLYAIDRGPTLSLLTSIWNTPAEYLRALHATVAQQDWRHFEWIVLDNGTTEEATIVALEEISRDETVRFFRADENCGIVGGMRYCLERATADYVLPLDSDDLLYPDALRVMAWHIEHAGRLPLLYSDEDKIRDEHRRDPYFKPAWDPVLFLNSCYIAHLCAIDRRLALELGLYSDAAAEGCHDWDSFIRFMLAGYSPVHVPEVLYSWRMHGASAALNIESKPYLAASHQHVLGRFLAAQGAADRCRVAPNPLFKGTPDWWFRRDHSDARPLLSIVLGNDGVGALRRTSYPRHEVVGLPLTATPIDLSDVIRQHGEPGALVQLVAAGIELEGDEWPWEAIALMELHPDTVMVAGHVFDHNSRIIAAGEYFGIGGDCGCPDVGRPVQDPGYFAQMWKQRSVSAASTILAVTDGVFLDQALAATPPGATLRFLGAWAGAHAARTHRRVVYSPHISGRGRLDRAAWDREITSEERAAFRRLNADLIPELRFLSPMLSLAPDTLYEPMAPDATPRGYMQPLRDSRGLETSGVA
jgi:SAM-dependent methyltransferase